MNRSQSGLTAKWPLLLIVALLCSIAWADSRDLIFEIDPSAFPGCFYRIMLDSNGNYIMGQGDGYGGGTWYYYPATGYYRQWFYNDPYDPDREGYLYYRVFITANDYAKSVSFDVHFNWTTAAWSQLGHNRPPLPSDCPTAGDEAKYMDTEELQALDSVFLGNPTSPGSVEPAKTRIIREYNPEWVSIDVRGKNCDIHRGAMHECRGKQGACCNHATLDCSIEYQEDCEAPYDWLGSGTTCEDCSQQQPQKKADVDFGDAPDSYATTLANDGARHTIVAGVYLGAKVDGELDGKPSASAANDKDDDGVQLTTALSPGETASVDVTASIEGHLNAWIDFNDDGSFNGRDEQIFADTKLSRGVNHLSFRVPDSAATGDTYARFRFNTRGLLSYKGLAQDGEVEDYKVSIVRSFEPQTNSGRGGVKWSQPAQSSDAATPFMLKGWDEASGLHLHQIVADDWQCADERPVTGFQWWGSFDNWTKSMLPPVQPLAFHIGVWTNAAGKADANHPDTLLWETYCTQWTWNVAGQEDAPQGLSRGETCFQFTCLLSQDQWFYQSPTVGADGKSVPTVYWLSIAAVYDTDVPTPANPFGWTTRPYAFNNGAVHVGQVAGAGTHSGSWPPTIGSQWLAGTPIEYPRATKWDLAFELLTNQAGSEGGQTVDADLAPVYRLKAEKLNSYFYTISASEKDTLLRDFANVWKYDGVAFYAYPPDHQPVGSKPVYRFWSPSLSSHFYTMDEREKQQMADQSKVWTLEGVAWNAFNQPPATK
jgi:hypothetical protein